MAVNATSDAWTITGQTATDWLRRRYIGLLGVKLGSTQTNFPVRVTLPTATWGGNVQGDGDDVAFVQTDGTVLDFELEKFDTDADSTFHVEIPSFVHGVNTQYVWMYYHNAGLAASLQDAAGTWDGNHQAVYHFNEASGNLLDSTGRGETLTPTGSPTYAQTGQVGPSILYPTAGGAADYFSGADIDGINGVSALTWEWWHYRTANTTNEYAIWQGDATNERVCIYYIGGGENMQVIFRNGASTYKAYTGAAGAAGSWHHYAMVYVGGGSPDVYLYVNGSLKSGSWVGGSCPATAPDCTGGTFRINSDWTLAQDVLVDELRVSSVDRSTDWLEASRLSQLDRLTTIGEEQSQADVLPLNLTTLQLDHRVDTLRMDHQLDTLGIDHQLDTLRLRG